MSSSAPDRFHGVRLVLEEVKVSYADWRASEAQRERLDEIGRAYEAREEQLAKEEPLLTPMERGARARIDSEEAEIGAIHRRIRAAYKNLQDALARLAIKVTVHPSIKEIGGVIAETAKYPVERRIAHVIATVEEVLEAQTTGHDVEREPNVANSESQAHAKKRTPRKKQQESKALNLRIQNVARKYQQKHGEPPKHRELCKLLDNESVPLPAGSDWESPNWKAAFEKYPGRVYRWLSECLKPLRPRRAI